MSGIVRRPISTTKRTVWGWGFMIESVLSLSFLSKGKESVVVYVFVCSKGNEGGWWLGVTTVVVGRLRPSPWSSLVSSLSPERHPVFHSPKMRQTSKFL